MEKKIPNCSKCKWSSRLLVASMFCMAVGGKYAATIHNTKECKSLYEEKENVEPK